MAELSNHSYHYDRNILTSLPSFEPPLDLFDSLLPNHEIDPSPISPVNLDENQDDKDVDGETNKKEKDSKKKSRRRRRNLTGVSKQRRAANERERKRLQIINMAFKDLKGILPLFPNENNISKIEIVKLAGRTIKYLSELVNNDQENDMNNMENTRSPGGSVASDSSESGSSISNESTFPDFEHEAKMLAPEDIDISNLLSNYEELSSMDITQSPTFLQQTLQDFKPSEELTDGTAATWSNSRSIQHQPTESSASSVAFTSYRQQKLSSTSTNAGMSSTSSSSSSDGFSGYDFHIFLDNSNDSDEAKDDVFPSMLSFW